MRKVKMEQIERNIEESRKNANFIIRQSQPFGRRKNQEQDHLESEKSWIKSL